MRVPMEMREGRREGWKGKEEERWKATKEGGKGGEGEGEREEGRKERTVLVPGVVDEGVIVDRLEVSRSMAQSRIPHEKEKTI